MRNILFSKITVKTFVSIMMLMIGLPTFAQNPVENPWDESSKPLIDKSTKSAGSNSWRSKHANQSSDGYDESKYPPLDENTALGSGYPSPADESAAYGDARSGNQDGYYNPQLPNYRQMPEYPSNLSRNYSNYNNRQFPAYQRNYQRNYRPGYPARFGSGSNYPGGLPFFGNSMGGFPFSMGNGSMPFSGQGFW